MNRFVAKSLAFASALLTACAHSPKVHYLDYGDKGLSGTSDDFASGAIKFQLAASMLVLAPPKKETAAAAAPAGAPAPKAAAEPSTSRALLASLSGRVVLKSFADFQKLDPQISVARAPAAGAPKALVTDDPFYFRANLSPQYVPGTYMLSSLGAAAEDNSLAVVSAVGSIATTLVATGLFFDTVVKPPAIPNPPDVSSTLTLPQVIDVSYGLSRCARDSFDGEDDKGWCALDGSSWTYAFKVGRSFATLSSVEFFKAAHEPGSGYARLFPVSTCLQITVAIREKAPGPGKDSPAHLFDITVADPSRVDGVLIPSKGAIAMPDVCGANLTVQPSGAPSELDVLGAIATQVAAVKKARASGK